jgi:hypothetical protein
VAGVETYAGRTGIAITRRSPRAGRRSVRPHVRLTSSPVHLPAVRVCRRDSAVLASSSPGRRNDGVTRGAALEQEVPLGETNELSDHRRCSGVSRRTRPASALGAVGAGCGEDRGRTGRHGQTPRRRRDRARVHPDPAGGWQDVHTRVEGDRRTTPTGRFGNDAHAEGRTAKATARWDGDTIVVEVTYPGDREVHERTVYSLDGDWLQIAQETRTAGAAPDVRRAYYKRVTPVRDPRTMTPDPRGRPPLTPSTACMRAPR